MKKIISTYLIFVFMLMTFAGLLAATEGGFSLGIKMYNRSTNTSQSKTQD